MLARWCQDNERSVRRVIARTPASDSETAISVTARVAGEKVGLQSEKELKRIVWRLEKSGWSLRNADIDLVANRAVIEARRMSDGRVVRAVATGHSAYVETEIEVARQRLDSFKKQPYQFATERQLLGRQRSLGARNALRNFCAYLADNAPEGYMPLNFTTAKQLIAPLLEDPVVLHVEKSTGR